MRPETTTKAEAYRRIGEAFSTLIEFDSYMTLEAGDNVLEAITEIYDNATWLHRPEIVRQMLPLLLECSVKSDPDSACRKLLEELKQEAKGGAR